MGRGALTFRLPLPVSAAEALAWHERPGVPARLSPPWASERERSGPAAGCTHVRRVLPEGQGCVLEDRLEWRRAAGPLSAPADALIARELARRFAWRHRVTRLDLERAAARTSGPLAVGVTGASGFLGRELCAYLASQGHRVVRFVRGRPAGPGEIAWDPARDVLDPAALAALDGVVHLSGAGIADRAWSPERKRELVESRVRSTQVLAGALARANAWPRPNADWQAGETPRAGAGPRVLVSASAVGWYGDRGDEPLDEASAAGRGFLADLAQRWEAAAAPARSAGVRVVHPRIGVVLWPRGGALAKLAPPFRWGAGGPLGGGRAWWSWITLHDLLDVLRFALEQETLAGAVNAVAPAAARQRELARALGRALSRPALASAPAFALRALLGRERADGMLLASQRVEPGVLRSAGFAFRDPELAPALARLYGVPRLAPAR